MIVKFGVILVALVPVFYIFLKRGNEKTPLVSIGKKIREYLYATGIIDKYVIVDVVVSSVDAISDDFFFIYIVASVCLFPVLIYRKYPYFSKLNNKENHWSE